MKSKSKSIPPVEFFKKIALDSGVNDLQSVRDIFYGMVRTISRELRENREVELPDWGTFVLRMHKERRSKDVNDGLIRIIPPRPTVKFVPNYKVKKYFRSLG